MTVELASHEVFLVSAERAPTRAMSALTGAHPETVGGTLRGPTGADDPDQLLFSWPDTQPLQLLMPGLADKGRRGLLAGVGQAHGDAAVRDLLALCFFSWAARASAGQAFWWWPSEHLELVGLRPRCRDTRRRLRRRIARFRQTDLTAHHATGPPLVGPLVAELLSDGQARLLHIHPAFVKGVTGFDGRAGGYWWALPLQLLRMPANRTAGRVHLLGPLLAHSWRAALRHGGGDSDPPEARFRAERLADLLGLQTVRSRAATTLKISLDSAAASGLVGEWWARGPGDLARLGGTVHATPGAGALNVLRTRQVARPAWIPATGEELEAWIRDSGATSASAAKLLGTTGGSLRRVVSTHRERPLPSPVRDLLRRHLWPPAVA